MQIEYLHETIPEAMRPGLTDREAVLNSSDCFVEKRVYTVENQGSQRARVGLRVRHQDVDRVAE